MRVDSPSNDETWSSGLGDSPAGVEEVVWIAIYLVGVGTACCLGLWAIWPNCPVPPSLTKAEQDQIVLVANAAKKMPTADTKDPPTPKKSKEEKKLPPPPAASSVVMVEPDTGSTAGHECVTIHGSGFTEKTFVIFGGKPIPSLAKGSHMLVVSTPPHAPGKVTVSVRHPDTPLEVLGGSFTYQCPPAPTDRDLILMVLMDGSIGGCLHGLRSLGTFVGNRQFKRSWILYYFILPVCGGMIALIFYLLARSGLYAPQGNEKDLFLVGVAAIVGLFAHLAMDKLKQIAETVLTKASTAADPIRPVTNLKITSMTPLGGPSTGGTTVVLSGEGLATVKEVRFGTTEARIVSKNDTTITATTPPHAVGLVDVTVLVDADTKVVKQRGFAYADLKVTKVTSPQGPANHSHPVQIIGEGFFGELLSVSFAGQNATNIQLVSPTKITAVTPALAAGKATVEVKFRDGRTVSLADAYTSVPFRLVSVAPASGQHTTEVDVTITGEGFLGETPAVSFGAKPATKIRIDSPTAIKATVPQALAAGKVEVKVTLTDGPTATLPDGYEYL